MKVGIRRNSGARCWSLFNEICFGTAVAATILVVTCAVVLVLVTLAFATAGVLDGWTRVVRALLG